MILNSKYWWETTKINEWKWKVENADAYSLKRPTQHGYEKVGRLDLKGNKLEKDQRADCVRSSGLSEGETKGLKRTEK